MTVLVIGGVFGFVGLAMLADAAAEKRKSPIADWAATRGLTVTGERCTTRVDGIPVTIDGARERVVSARYVLGAGPRFGLSISSLLPQARKSYGADALVQLIHAQYKRSGLASDATPLVVKAILAHVRSPIRPPRFAAEDGVVMVRDVASIDLAVALAAAIAGDGLARFAPLAKALGASIEIGDDGRVYVDVALRTTIRMRMLASETDASAHTVVFSGAIESGAADLVHAPFELEGEHRGRLAAPRPDADDALEWLLHHGAHVSLRPRDVEARFDAPPSVDQVRRIVDSLDTVLAHGGESPFR